MGRRCITILLICVMMVFGRGRTGDSADIPRLVPVPNSSVSYAPNVPYDLFFFNKTWFYFYEGKWYRSREHRGPWTYLRDELVPEPLRPLPREMERVKREEHPKASTCGTKAGTPKSKPCHKN